jgi:hypothetical protein
MGHFGIGTIIVGVVLVVLMIGLERSFRNATGVSMPSRNSMRHTRRRARKRGITHTEAFSGWLARKQRSIRGGPATFVASPTATRRNVEEGYVELCSLAERTGHQLRRTASGTYLILDRRHWPIGNPLVENSTDFTAEQASSFFASLGDRPYDAIALLRR